MRVGLLGGSFNPPHPGHVHISKIALNALHLDAVWWIVTPHNPLKEKSSLLPYEERIKYCHKIVDHPKVIVTDIEDSLGTTTTYETISKMNTYFPHTRFVWITGMDNALNLHKWNDWQALLKKICMLHITRHPAVSLTQRCPQRLLQNHRHVILQRGGRVKIDSGITYWLLQKKMVNISSTEIRKKNKVITEDYMNSYAAQDKNIFA